RGVLAIESSATSVGRSSRERLHHMTSSVLIKSVAAICLLAASASAQAVYGTLRGVVVDPSGLPTAGAKVTIRNQVTRETRSALTDTSGNFIFPALVPSTYTVAAEAPGFKKFETRDIPL